MGKIISKKSVFTNPITGEEKIMSVQAALPDEQLKACVKFGIDVDSMTEKAIQKELDYRVGSEHTNIIIEYAKNSNNVFDVDLSNNLLNIQDSTIYKAEKIMQSIYKSVISFRDPVVYTNIAISYILRDSKILTDYKNNYGNPCESYTYQIGTKAVKVYDSGDKDKALRIPFFCITSWEYDRTEMLIYDLNNPKLCLYVDFKNVIH
jgi:hypothetical protein